MTSIRHVAVLGAGTMGHGITYVSALAGYHVSLTDVDADTLARGSERIGAAFEKAIARGKCSAQERDAALARLLVTPERDRAVRDADLVIEAVPERLELKQQLLGKIEALVPPDALLASNTSSLSITTIAEPLRHPERVLGLHFFNPVPAMKLIEIVRGDRTADAAVAAAREFATSLGKTPIVVRDTPGFATSRLGVVLGLEAIRMLEQGVASAQDIDRAMELGYNHPVGPLKLTDMVGLDVRLAIAEHLHETLHDDQYRPPALLREMVRDGRLGKKSGQGFYPWENDR
ncbi:MAG TPA: 3-hydroxyacyl-CoA dehydrogenase family protein [Gemmatimonadaceae bacterium]|nr:3-hydroxyacyl-CoA dehydrogenase family protein [Gemmatimonadaceae bacterium]